MKTRLVRIAVLFALLAPFLAFAAAAFGQTTQPAAPFAVPRPKVIVGAWNVPVADFDKWKARGVNVLISPGLVGKKDQAELDAWFAAAAAKGLWAVGDPLASKPPPNLFAFMLPDELDAKQADPKVSKWDGLTPAQVKPMFDRFRGLDPTIPVFMSLAGPKITSGNRLAYYQSLAPYCDLWMEDWYPINWGPDRYPQSLVAQAIAVLKQAAPDKPVVAMLEVGDQNLKSQPLGRGPTAAEVAGSIAIAKAAGADGFGCFSHYFADSGAWAGFDNTQADVAAVLAVEFGKLNPPVDPAVAALRSALDALSQQAAADRAQLRQAQADVVAARASVDLINDWIRRAPGAAPATQPAK